MTDVACLSHTFHMGDANPSFMTFESKLLSKALTVLRVKTNRYGWSPSFYYRTK